MANADTPSGFRPIGNLSGAPYTGATVKCAILAADETATFIGDLVRLSGSSSTEGYPSVEQGAATDTDFFGVVTSFDPSPTDLETVYRKADTLRNCNVVPCYPGQLFVIQSQTGEATAIEDVGLLADIVVGSGSTSTGLSGMELDTAGTNANLQILGIVERTDNTTGANADLIVRVNEHVFGGDGTEV